MKQLNIIPNPNKIDYLGGSVKMENIDSESFSARLTDKLPEEGYVLEVTENGIEATAGGERGAFYASQTLKQLKQLDICPCVRIEDAPAFEYRAFMLDCARHMTTVENIKKLIDAAALVKMNTMHWHLTDDQGWRVEIDSHPELITVGSRRRSSDFGQYHFAEEYSGYFTKDEIREVVAYADDNYIEVIPEFDMPGHTLSVLAAYPEEPIRLAGDGYSLAFAAFREAGAAHLTETPPDLRLQNAEAVARCALRLARAGETVDDEALRPLYLRLPQAERDLLEKQAGHTA